METMLKIHDSFDRVYADNKGMCPALLMDLLFEELLSYRDGEYFLFACAKFESSVHKMEWSGYGFDNGQFEIKDSKMILRLPIDQEGDVLIVMVRLYFYLTDFHQATSVACSPPVPNLLHQ